MDANRSLVPEECWPQWASRLPAPISETFQGAKGTNVSLRRLCFSAVLLGKHIMQAEVITGTRLSLQQKWLWLMLQQQQGQPFHSQCAYSLRGPLAPLR